MKTIKFNAFTLNKVMIFNAFSYIENVNINVNII